MCGILAALGLSGDPENNRRLILRCSKLLRHRGPDANSIWQSKDGKTFLAFERLQIIDPSDGGRYDNLVVIFVRCVRGVAAARLFTRKIALR